MKMEKFNLRRRVRGSPAIGFIHDSIPTSIRWRETSDHDCGGKSQAYSQGVTVPLSLHLPYHSVMVLLDHWNHLPKVYLADVSLHTGVPFLEVPLMSALVPD